MKYLNYAGILFGIFVISTIAFGIDLLLIKSEKSKTHLEVYRRACTTYKVTYKGRGNSNYKYRIKIKRYDIEGNELVLFNRNLGYINTNNRSFFNSRVVGKTYKSKRIHK